MSDVIGRLILVRLRDGLISDKSQAAQAQYTERPRLKLVETPHLLFLRAGGLQSSCVWYFFVQLQTGKDTCYSIMTWKQNEVIKGFIKYKINSMFTNLFVSIVLFAPQSPKSAHFASFARSTFESVCKNCRLLESTLCDVSMGTDSFVMPLQG